MNRGVITISESGTVSMPTDTVWMTMQEIADMYNVFSCYVRKAVNTEGYRNDEFKTIHIIADAVVLSDMTTHTLLFQNAVLEYSLDSLAPDS